MKLDRLDLGRGVWLDLAWRTLEVFMAALLVQLGAGASFIRLLRSVPFWEEVVDAAIVALISSILALASARAGAVSTPPDLPPGPP